LGRYSVWDIVKRNVIVPSYITKNGRGMMRRESLVILLAVFTTFAVSSVAAFSWTNPIHRALSFPLGAQSNIQIVEPAQDNSVVKKETSINGIAHLSTGNHLWVLVHRKGFPKDIWWPQDEVKPDPQTGQWAIRISVGMDSDIGNEFVVAAVPVDEEYHHLLRQARQSAMHNNDWAVVKMPRTTSAPVYRKIRRAGNKADVVNGQAISLPQPAYPTSAREAGASGSVVVQIIVDEQGAATSARAISGDRLLYEAAESAGRRARFKPTLVSGHPAKVIGTVTYYFQF
jgi:TonB family protein